MGNREHMTRSNRRVVTLRNLSANYTAKERAFMRALPEAEREFIHTAKALFGGVLR